MKYKDYLKDINVLVFDFDGVIMNTSVIKTDAFYEVFSRYPRFLKKIWKFHLKNKGIPRELQFRHLVCNLIGEKDSKASKHINRLITMYKKIILPKLISAKFINGSFKTIKYAHKKFSMYIVSNAPASELKLITKKKKIDKYFKKIFSSKKSINKSQALKKILRIENIPPKYLLFIGDTSKDQIAAKKSLVKFLGLNNNLSNFSNNYGIRINKMNQLHLLLKEINNLIDINNLYE